MGINADWQCRLPIGHFIWQRNTPADVAGPAPANKAPLRLPEIERMHPSGRITESYEAVPAENSSTRRKCNGRHVEWKRICMAKKNLAARQVSAARNHVAQKQAQLERKKKEPEKLAKKKQTEKRKRKQEELARREEMERRREKTQSIIILCACAAAALIISNWSAIASLFS
jgi:hypothetical protein